MPDHKAKCPTCDGGGEIYGIGCTFGNGCRPMSMECDRCRGSGDIPETMLEWIERGKEMREDRRSRGLVLREEAARLGVKMSTLSQMERGIIEPVLPPGVRADEGGDC